MSIIFKGKKAATELNEFIHDHGPDCLIIIRHGETKWNAEGRLQGQQDTSLSHRGRRQTRQVAQRLRHVPILQIHSSPLKRCHETANSIAIANVSHPAVVTDSLLKETALGILEGELKSAQSTAELTATYEEFDKDEINYRIPGGENLHDVAARVSQFFADQREILKNPRIQLIVGHRNLNKMIIKYLLGLSYDNGFRVEQEHHRLYLYFSASKELWSCSIEREATCLSRGYATTMDSSYA
jgi:probable phosphoglycerate mutase